MPLGGDEQLGQRVAFAAHPGHAEQLAPGPWSVHQRVERYLHGGVLEMREPLGHDG